MPKSIEGHKAVTLGVNALADQDLLKLSDKFVAIERVITQANLDKQQVYEIVRSKGFKPDLVRRLSWKRLGHKVEEDGDLAMYEASIMRATIARDSGR